MQVRSTPRLRIVAAAVLLAAACGGCSSGPPTGEVQGKVTFQGNPVREGRVTFLNLTEGGAAEADIQSDGTYVVKNPVVVGDYVIEIKPLMHMVDTDPGRTPPSPEEKPAPDIPEKYRMQGSTPLRETVKTGKNVFDFNMTP